LRKLRSLPPALIFLQKAAKVAKDGTYVHHAAGASECLARRRHAQPDRGVCERGQSLGTIVASGLCSRWSIALVRGSRPCHGTQQTGKRVGSDSGWLTHSDTSEVYACAGDAVPLRSGVQSGWNCGRRQAVPAPIKRAVFRQFAEASIAGCFRTGHSEKRSRSELLEVCERAMGTR
jgi:hypothetical protein